VFPYVKRVANVVTLGTAMSALADAELNLDNKS
jgi:hypothetical protein